MGRLNLNLMKGIEETEQQIQKEKQPQESSVSKVAEKKSAEEPSARAEKAPKASSQPTAVPKKESQKKEKGREEKQVFSFRASLGEIALWRAFATATGEKIEHIGCKAMNEYVKRYKLTGAELAVFEALLAREEKS